MSDPTAKFVVELKDETSGAAKNAAASLERLKRQIDSDQKALRAMQTAMRQLKGGSVTNVVAFKKLRDEIDAKKNSIAQARGAFVELGGSFAETASGAGGLSEALAGIGSSASGALAVIGPMVLALAAVTAGVVAFTAATIAATAALTRYAVGQSNARRSELLRLQGLATIRSIYGVTRASGEEVQGAVDRMTDRVALSRGEIMSYAETLQRAGLRGRDFTDALEAASIAASVQGDQFGRRFLGRAIGAARTGHDVTALADDVRARLGGIARRQMLDWNRITERLTQNWNRLFDGLNLEPFLAALDRITSMLSQSEISGQSLRQIFSVLLQPFVDSLGNAEPLAERLMWKLIHFGQRLTILYLDVSIAIIRMRNQWRRFAETSIGRLAITATLDALKAVAAGVVIGLLFLVATVAAIGAVITAAAAACVAFAVAVGSLTGAAAAAVVSFGEWAGAMGSRLIDGLVNGIRNGVARVRSAIAFVGNAARDALRDVLQIHSPSRVFAGLGAQISRGVAVGVEAEAPSAQSAVEGMVSAPNAPNLSVASGRGAMSISIGDVIINATGNAPTAESLGEDFREKLMRTLEEIVIEMGAVRT